ncbi:bacterial regulatory s, tetR family protein [Mycobacterium xenopi 4042]|uniref:Bacterial regulatory s, tetR family protein n=1 Tax=Mycobacterium xenopi 4042 TaxID=1299334 RepID=X8EY91_MYCXE|nr:bacterial regulatory s, tetR family protein [Mycobacterium xenopi 3993]EUA84983.1 bacterial regulatory s, tetR family protein [Mycobacterium xenopi 4042]
MLAATRQLLVEVGYQRTTIAAVARRAGSARRRSTAVGLAGRR